MVESFLFFFGGIGPLGFAPAPSPTMTASSVLNQPRPARSQEVQQERNPGQNPKP
jgi:hypothetical protein